MTNLARIKPPLSAERCAAMLLCNSLFARLRVAMGRGKLRRRQLRASAGFPRLWCTMVAVSSCGPVSIFPMNHD